MAILSSANLLSEQRYQVSDARRIESAVRSDFDTLTTSIFTGTSQGYIVRGFYILTSGAIGAAANTLQMVVDPGAVLHIASSVSGTIFQTPVGTANQVLSASTNPNVSGSFTANATNYVGLEYNRFADSGTNETKYIWVASSKNEIQSIAPASQTLTFKIVISSSPWASNVLPISIVKTNADGTVASISDARWNMYSLETGGVSPNPSNRYAWSAGRSRPPVTIDASNSASNPFAGGDKQLSSFKDFADAVMTSFWEIKGTPDWFSTISSGSMLTLREDLGNTIFTGTGVIDQSSSTAGQINWSSDIYFKIVGSNLSYKIPSNPAGTCSIGGYNDQGSCVNAGGTWTPASNTSVTLSDEQVAYITLSRDKDISPNLIFTNGSNSVTSVGSVSWTTNLLAGDWIKLSADDHSGYYQIQSITNTSTVVLTTNYAGTSTGVSGAKSQYAYGVFYLPGGYPSDTTREITIANRGSVPLSGDVLWLFSRNDNGAASAKVYIKWLGAELDQGQSSSISNTEWDQVRQYIGQLTLTQTAPQYVTALDPGSVAQVTLVTVPAASSMTSGQYWYLYSSADARLYAVWVKIDGSGSQPNAPGPVSNYLEWDVLSSDTASQCATKLATALNGTVNKDFTAVDSTDTVTITNRSAGVTTDATAGTVSGLSVSTTTSGTGQGNYVIQDGDSLTLAIKKLDDAVGGIVTSTDDPNYNETLLVVSSGASGNNQINGPITSGTDITIPLNSRLSGSPQQYFTVGYAKLVVYLNGQKLIGGSDYTEVGTSTTTSDQIQVQQDIDVDDVLEFRITTGGGGGFGGGDQGPQGLPGPAGKDALNGPIPISTKTSSYTVLTSDGVLLADCTSGNITFTLPSASSASGKVFYFKKIDGSSNTMTVQRSGSDSIDGGTSLSTSTPYWSYTLVSDGTSYWDI